jgi:hypothetical protein
LENHYAVAAPGDRLPVCLLTRRFRFASIFESLRNLPAHGQFNVAVDAHVDDDGACLRRAFSLGFQAGEIAVFILWRGRQPNLTPMARWIMPEL